LIPLRVKEASREKENKNEKRQTVRRSNLQEKLKTTNKRTLRWVKRHQRGGQPPSKRKKKRNRREVGRSESPAAGANISMASVASGCKKTNLDIMQKKRKRSYNVKRGEGRK